MGMSKTNGLIFLSVLICTPCFGAGSSPVQRLNKNGVALCEDRDSDSDKGCYDPVSYLTEKKAEAAGAVNAQKFRASYEGATYVFTSEAHKSLFLKSPEKFVPQYGGWCAYAVAAKSEKVDIDPRSFHVQDGRLLLFYNGVFSDTRKTWLSDKNKDAKTYLSEADAHWPTTKIKEP